MFEKYIKETTDRNNIENIHCNSFSSTLVNKKNHISLEFQKYCDQLNELINYFLECNESIDKQINNKELINFLVEKRNKDIS